MEVSAGSFVAQMRARRKMTQELRDGPSDEDVVRSIKGILNKLTLEKFAPLYGQLVSCGMSTIFHVEQLIREVFDKATTQHQFIDMYADLCEQLHEFFTDNPIGNDRNAFKKILLHECQ